MFSSSVDSVEYRKLHPFSATCFLYQSAFAHCKRELISICQTIKCWGRGRAMAFACPSLHPAVRVRPSVPLWHSLILFAQSSSVFVLSLVRETETEREREREESQLSRWLPLQGTCVKIAIHQHSSPSPSHSHPIHHCRARGGRHVPMRLRRVPTMGHSFAKCCGSHPKGICSALLQFLVSTF